MVITVSAVSKARQPAATSSRLFLGGPRERGNEETLAGESGESARRGWVERRERRARGGWREVYGGMILRGEAQRRAYTPVGGRVGRRSEAILLIKRWGIDPNKLTIKPDESPRDRASTTFHVSANVSVYARRTVYTSVSEEHVFAHTYTPAYVCIRPRTPGLFRPTLFFPTTESGARRATGAKENQRGVVLAAGRGE